jgi:hypothetical protein
MAVLQYDLSVTGTQAVDAAFAHVEARARRANRLIAREGAKASGAGRAVSRGAAAAVAGEAAMGAPVPRWWARQQVPMVPTSAGRWGRGNPAGAAQGPAERRRGGPGATAMAGAATRATGRQAAAAADLADLPGQRPLTRADSAREQAMEARHAERVARIRERSGARVAKLEEAAAKKSGREREAAEKRAAAAAERSRQRLERITSQSQLRQQQRAEAAARRLELEKDRHSKRRVEAEARAQLAAARHARIAAERQGMATRSATARAALGSVATLGRSAATFAAIGGTALVGNAVYKRSQDISVSQRLANQAGTPERQAAILEGATKVQGFTTTESLSALEKWTDVTGDLPAGEKILGELGATALATGTQLDELAAAAANAFIPIKDSVPDAVGQMQALKNIIRATAGMGAVGAVEVKDLASEMAGLAAQAPKFAGTTEEVMATAVAMAQATRQRGGAASAPEAVTSVERFGSDVMNKQAKLRAMGVEVFTDDSHTKLKGQKDLMTEILDKTGGDLGKLGDIFSERSIRAVQGFAPLYNQAEKKEKGSGKAAVLAEFARLEKATLTDESQRARVSAIMQTPEMQLKETFKALNKDLGAEFIPILQELVKSLQDATPNIVAMGKAAAGVARFFVENPFAGVGALVSGAIVKEVVAARIGAAISGSIAKGGGLDLKLAGAAIAITAATLMVEKLSDAREEAVNKNVREGIAQTNLENVMAGQLRNPTAFLNWSPEQGASPFSTDIQTKAQEELTRLRALRDSEDAAAAASQGAAAYGAGAGVAASAATAKGGPADIIAGMFGDLTNWMGITDPGTTKGTAERVAESQLQGNTSELDARIAKLEALLAKGGETNMQAATKMATAADVIAKAAPGLNRGNTPSPVPAVK